MDDSQFDDVLDDWFIESLKTYKDLHVFQLDAPTPLIEWTSEETVCVSGYRPSKNELLQLRLPLKLLAEDKGLCAERDFRVVHGGLTEGPVCGLTHLPGTRCVVTNDGRSSDLQLWELGGDDSDVIRRTGSVEGRSLTQTGSRTAARLCSQPDVLHGAESDCVRLSQLTTGRTLYQSGTPAAEPLSSLHFVGGHVFLAACRNGNVFLADTRTPAAPQGCGPPASAADSALWWTDAAGAEPSDCRVLRVSSAGRAAVSDLRNPGRAVCGARLGAADRRWRPDELRASWAPALQGGVAVSGFGGEVEIYDSSVWGAEPGEARPLFRHRGHAVSSPDGDVAVTAHRWHPRRPRTLLSAASDGSLHVWDWVDPSDAGS